MPIKVFPEQVRWDSHICQPPPLNIATQLMDQIRQPGFPGGRLMTFEILRNNRCDRPPECNLCEIGVDGPILETDFGWDPLRQN